MNEAFEKWWTENMSRLDTSFGMPSVSEKEVARAAWRSAWNEALKQQGKKVGSPLCPD